MDSDLTDAGLMAAVLRRFVEEREYWCVGDDFLTLDGKVDVTPDEREAIMRTLDVTDGQGWWNESTKRT